MEISAHPSYSKVRRRLEETPDLVRPWRGAVYRVTTFDYARPEIILGGEGSFLYGGRWNAIGSFRAVYGSTTEIVAVAESKANLEYANLSAVIRTPRLLVTVEMELSAVLNLRQIDVLGQLELGADELRGGDWRKLQAEGRESLTQCVGRAAFDAGMQGLLAPSAKVEGGVNVVYFPKSGRREEEVRVCEPETLDRIEGRL